MAYIKGLSVKLQGKWQNIVHAHDNIETILKQLSAVRSKLDWFHEAKGLASKVNVEPSVPRKTCHQKHRVNVPANSPSEYYKRAVTIPFLDHLISETNNRFNKYSLKKFRVLKLIPPNVYASKSCLTSNDIKDFLAVYGDDLPNIFTLSTELHCSSLKWTNDKKLSEGCNTIVKALNKPIQTSFQI